MLSIRSFRRKLRTKLHQYSLKQVHIDRNEFLAVVIEYLERELLTNDLRLTEKALEEYTSLCATIGRNVSFSEIHSS